MSERNNRPTSRGKVWRNLSAGEPTGRPLSEWAYVTPRFLSGIKASDLATNADVNVQRETALFWFWSNFKPYDLSKGGPYFGFAPRPGSPPDPQIAGFGQGVFAPGRVDAFHALNEEFGRILPEILLRRMGESLGSNWMWAIEQPYLAIDPQHKEEVLVFCLANRFI
jgi:hypothetical protein